MLNRGRNGLSRLRGAVVYQVAVCLNWFGVGQELEEKSQGTSKKGITKGEREVGGGGGGVFSSHIVCALIRRKTTLGFGRQEYVRLL